MLVAALVIGGLGVASAVALGVAAKVFYVEVDPLIAQIESALPGANCGGCGQAGCSGAAEAIATGKMPPNGCVAGGAEVAVVISAIMGVEVRETEPEKAQVGCRYPLARSDVQFDYAGVTDCRAAHLLFGGPKECPVGCIGLGSCVKSCPFDALSIGSDGLPVVNEEKCTGCGTCVRVCPVGIMRLTSVSRRILNEFDWEQCTAPCQRRCPAGIDIPKQLFLTAKGDYEGALLTIKERNPLPLICGRICPNPCEIACRRNLADEPVAINPLKRFVADLEMKSDKRLQCYKAPSTNYKVAVIGGGVEGLSAAYFLARMGHSPAIYESRPYLGGLLRNAIPESRLPRNVLDYEIQGILDMGVEAHTSTAFGRDVPLSRLFDEGVKAVLMATGGWDALLMPGQTFSPQQALPQVYLLLPLTLAWASGDEPPLGDKTVIVGNGREALSAARKCLQKGSSKVTILNPDSAADMGLKDEEMKAAASEGITVIHSARVTRLYGKGDQVTEMGYLIGRGHEQRIPTDTIIVSGGRLPDLIITPTPQPQPEGDEEPPVIPGHQVEWLTVQPYHPGKIWRGLFHTGEPVSDFRAAVEAIGAGRRAASSIHYLHLNADLPELDVDIVRGPAQIDVDHLENLLDRPPRVLMPMASPMEQLDPKKEVALGYDEAMAKKEASRCLNCGLICYYRTQYN